MAFPPLLLMLALTALLLSTLVLALQIAFPRRLESKIAALQGEKRERTVASSQWLLKMCRIGLWAAPTGLIIVVYCMHLYAPATVSHALAFGIALYVYILTSYYHTRLVVRLLKGVR